MKRKHESPGAGPPVKQLREVSAAGNGETTRNSPKTKSVSVSNDSGLSMTPNGSKSNSSLNSTISSPTVVTSKSSNGSAVKKSTSNNKSTPTPTPQSTPAGKETLAPKKTPVTKSTPMLNIDPNSPVFKGNQTSKGKGIPIPKSTSASKGVKGTPIPTSTPASKGLKGTPFSKSTPATNGLKVTPAFKGATSAKSTPGIRITPGSKSTPVPKSKPTPMNRKLSLGASSMPRNSLIKGILKGDNSSLETPGSSTRNVSFGPHDSMKITGILEKIKSKTDTQAELNDLLAYTVRNTGKSLIMCLEEITPYLRYMDKNHSSLIAQIIKMRWADQSEDVAHSFQKFLFSLLSFHPFFAKTILRTVLRLFMPQTLDDSTIPSSPLINKNVHSFLKKYLKKFGREKSEMMKQVVEHFPYFKHSAEKLISYLRGVLEMYRYISDTRQDLLEIVLEKGIQLDAGISREQINGYVKKYQKKNMKEEEDEEDSDSEDKKEDLNEEDKEKMEMDKRLCENIDAYMEALMIFLKRQTCVEKNKGESGVEDEKEGEEGVADEKEGEKGVADDKEGTEGVFEYDYCPEKSKELENILLKIFQSHLLTSDRICHAPFTIFFLASRNIKFGKEFLKTCWDVFCSPNTASIIRQSAISYLSGFVCRSMNVSGKLTKKWVSKIIEWIHERMGVASAHELDYMVVNLGAYGPLFSACQAVFYIIAFRYEDLVVEDDTTFLSSLKLTSIIAHPLNPLRVITPTVLKAFSAVVSFYQIAYCKSIIHRNNKITLPMVGLSSSGCTAQSKNLLLDKYFPFDPYNLPKSRDYISPYYRQYKPLEGVAYESEESEEEEDEDEEEDDDGEDEDEKMNELSMMLDTTPRRERTTSLSSNKRTRTTSFTDALARELMKGV